MELIDKFKLHGSMTAVLIHPDGSTEVVHKDNMIVNVGFDFIADSIGAASGRPAVMGYIGVGTGTTAAAGTQTGLVADLGARVAATYSHTPGDKSFSFAATFAPGVSTGAITEAGVFNAATNGVMLDRVVFAVLNKGANDTFVQTFTFTMS